MSNVTPTFIQTSNDIRVWVISYTDVYANNTIFNIHESFSFEQMYNFNLLQFNNFLKIFTSFSHVTRYTILNQLMLVYNLNNGNFEKNCVIIYNDSLEMVEFSIYRIKLFSVFISVHWQSWIQSFSVLVDFSWLFSTEWYSCSWTRRSMSDAKCQTSIIASMNNGIWILNPKSKIQSVLVCLFVSSLLIIYVFTIYNVIKGKIASSVINQFIIWLTD